MKSLLSRNVSHPQVLRRHLIQIVGGLLVVLLIVFYGLHLGSRSVASKPSIALPDSLQLTQPLHAPSVCVLDVASGKVLFSQDADSLRSLASLTRLMNMYVAWTTLGFDRAKPVVVPEGSYISQIQGSARLGLKPGERVLPELLMTAMASCSCNDAAWVMAHAVAGSKESFVLRMNAAACALGMRRTHFTDPNGYDAGNVTTAREYAKFCREFVRKFASEFPAWCTRSEILYPVTDNLVPGTSRPPKTLHNVNPALQVILDADGLKTGYTNAAGACLALTVHHGEARAVIVILGIHSTNEHLSRQWMVEDARTLWQAWLKGLPGKN